MENLEPTLRLIRAVSAAMDSGDSVRIGISQYLQQPADRLTKKVQCWFQLIERGCPTETYLNQIENIHHQITLRLLERGLRGEPIYSHLCLLGEEVQDQNLAEIEVFLAKLPIRMLLPLVFCLFPAFLLLLLGPLLLRVVAGLG